MQRMRRRCSVATSSPPFMLPTQWMKSGNSFDSPGCLPSTSIKWMNYIWWGGVMQLTEFVPREELERRWARVRRFMDCDSLLILQNVDQYYLTGTLQSGVLWLPREGEPLLAVRKSYERAKIESRSEE